MRQATDLPTGPPLASDLMCGIVAITSRPPTRPAPSAPEVLAALDAAVVASASDLTVAATHLEGVNSALLGLPGVLALAGHPEFVAGITARLDQLDAVAATEEARIEALEGAASEVLEAANATLIRLRDALWGIRKDRLRTAREVIGLAGGESGAAALGGYLAVQQSLSAIDRLEVRGRDSAGLHLFVWDHQLDLDDLAIKSLLDARATDPLFTSGSVRVANGVLSFVYKAAAEIGELGDNTRALRKGITEDVLLRLALRAPTARLSVLGHTRWASVGIISEPNAHPLNSEELDREATGPYVVGALNGDVDNHADLKAEHGLGIPALITTDAKVIPTLVSRHTVAAGDVTEGFRRTVSAFEGSVAIGAASATEPQKLLLALRGSGQALYVGLGDDCFVVASEPYGVVEETSKFLRLEGEQAAVPGNPNSRGQIYVLDGALAGTLEGVRRLAYDGTEIPVTEADVVTAEVTTRDIDRGDAPHFLFKEIGEAPESFRKTLRGKIVENDGQLSVFLGGRTFPPVVIEKLRSGAIRKVLVIGQGTAAVAGQSAAAVLDELAGGALDIDPITATELSGFSLRADMSDTLIVAVSQSGTTTDTNRTVDLARSRGALVIGIVNRRNSDLTDKADGVLYTSDGRDVEMSVASTKAFYAQVAAGVLLACAITDLAGIGSNRRRHELLTSLRELPVAMREVIERRPVIAEAAQQFAPSKRYWAVVGNGPNKVAAEEVRIKLSELCYKSIACDVTEDKKHIDLSSEPLILVCAAGLMGGTADDVAKEVAIYKAHKATPIVVASDGEDRFTSAAALIKVPQVDPALAFVLSAMVGHLFGYEAAMAIDALARPLRLARERIEQEVAAPPAGTLVRRIRDGIAPYAQQFFDVMRTSAFDGHLEASTAVRLASLLRDLATDSPLEAFQNDTGKVGTPEALIDDLTIALTRAIEELTRPVDAIKHQAKTVTVGISRSDEGVMDRVLVRAVLDAGASRDRLSYRAMKILADLDPAVELITGYTRYRITGDPASDGATIEIVDRGGLGRDVASRVERNTRLIGTKRRVANEREVLVARGRSDNRTVILVPEVKGGRTTGLTLVHVRFHDHLPADTMRGVLQGYDHRYDRLVDWVSETEGAFRDDRLAELGVLDALITPISEIADRWRS